MRTVVLVLAMAYFVVGCTAVPADHVPVWEQPINHGGNE